MIQSKVIARVTVPNTRHLILKKNGRGRDPRSCLAEKTKLMTNASCINTEIIVNGQKLKTVTSFKYLGSVITDEGSKPEIFSSIAQTTAETSLE